MPNKFVAFVRISANLVQMTVRNIKMNTVKNAQKSAVNVQRNAEE
jgi:hypothetical protein